MKNFQINLNYNYGYKWYSNNKVKVKGYIFDKKNLLYEEKNLLDYFENINTEEEFKERILDANGFFSVIIQKEKSIMIAVDKTRTFPLFYINDKNDFIISDDCSFLKDNYKNILNEVNIDEFLSIGHVMGKETLLQNIFQVQAGEYLIIDHNSLIKNFYLDYLTKEISTKNFSELKLEFLDILRDLIQRFIKFANGRQIVIPLSGGYDSRLIASLLRQANYDNVFCYTYGRKNTYEVIRSEKVAKKLNYNWLFIEYNLQTIDQNYPQNNKFQEFYKFTSNYTSTFHLQDYFAVKYLHDNKIIDNDAIFAPGHFGDFLSGSHLNKEKIPNKNNVIDVIYLKQNILNKKNFNKKMLTKKISSLIEVENIKEELIYAIDENFNLKERQSKFIINSIRNYEFFGYQHFMPLGDNKLIAFFKNLPFEYKFNSYFYEKILFEGIFSDLDVQFKKNTKIINEKNKNIIKELIRKVFPNFLVDIIMKYRDPDIVGQSVFTIPLQKEINKNIPIRNSNWIIAEWYISKIR